MKPSLPGLPALGDRPASTEHPRREKSGAPSPRPAGPDKSPAEETP